MYTGKKEERVREPLPREVVAIGVATRPSVAPPHFHIALSRRETASYILKSDQKVHLLSSLSYFVPVAIPVLGVET